MTRHPVCCGQSRRSSTRNLAASLGGCLGVVGALLCVRDALWKMIVCLDVLVSWLAGRLFNCFYGILLCFFSLKLGHDPTLTKLLFSRYFSPRSPDYNFKSLMEVAYI